jgi:Fe-S cluster biogenesis protein NfuA
MAQGVQGVIEHFQRILQADGGDLQLLGLADGVMKLQYRPGHNEACESCVLTPEDLKELVAEAAMRQDSSIRSVELSVT